MRGVFVTGSDTDIGKTFAARLLCDTIGINRNVTYFKPVQSGCISGRAPDYDYVMQGRAAPVCEEEIHVPYKFEPACSPHLSAEKAGVEISIDRIIECYQAIKEKQSLIIAEGAGGLLVPLTRDFMMVDLIRQLGLPVVLVTSSRLGTLNHTFLSIELLRSKHIPLTGVVFNHIDNRGKDFIYEDNLKTIREYAAPVPVLETAYNQQPNGEVRLFCDEITK